MTQLSIQEQLLVASKQNASLLATISETKYATSSYQQTTNYISQLKKQVTKTEKELKTISKTVASEYADHKAYRDSHLKRLAYRFGGKKEKFEQQATKEEKEWLDAVALELQTKKELEQLNRDLAQALKEQGELLAVTKVHHSATLELDRLYNEMFEGPTPEIPEEDVMENKVVDSGRQFDMLQLLLSTEQQAKNILLQADKTLRVALLAINEARSNNVADCWGVGGHWAEMAEQSNLSQCQQHVSQTQMLVMQAQHVQPKVQSIGDMQVAQMNFMSDIVFDNIFSDMDMRDRIKKTQSQIQAAMSRLRAEETKADERIRDAQKDVDEENAKLTQLRNELQTIRAEVFERVATGEMDGGLHSYAIEPPSYTA